MTLQHGVTMNMLDKQELKVFYDEHGIPSLQLENGETYHDIEINLLFPLTRRRTYVRFVDSEEDEIGIVHKMESLDEDSRAVVEQELQKTYFIPTVTKIYSIETKLGADEWKVKTEKGDRTFEVTGKRRNIRFYPDGLVVIKDIDGNRYEINSIRSLDAPSRKILEREL